MLVAASSFATAPGAFLSRDARAFFSASFTESGPSSPAGSLHAVPASKSRPCWIAFVSRMRVSLKARITAGEPPPAFPPPPAIGPVVVVAPIRALGVGVTSPEGAAVVQAARSSSTASKEHSRRKLPPPSARRAPERRSRNATALDGSIQEGDVLRDDWSGVMCIAPQTLGASLIRNLWVRYGAGDVDLVGGNASIRTERGLAAPSKTSLGRYAKAPR